MSVEKARWGGETCRKEERAVGKGTEIDGKITRDDGIDWVGFCTAARIKSVSHRNVWDGEISSELMSHESKWAVWIHKVLSVSDQRQQHFKPDAEREKWH